MTTCLQKECESGLSRSRWRSSGSPHAPVKTARPGSMIVTVAVPTPRARHTILAYRSNDGSP